MLWGFDRRAAAATAAVNAGDIMLYPMSVVLRCPLNPPGKHGFKLANGQKMLWRIGWTVATLVLKWWKANEVVVWYIVRESSFISFPGM